MSPKSAARTMRIASAAAFVFALAMAFAVNGDSIGLIDAYFSLMTGDTQGADAIASTEGKLSLAVAGGVFAGFAALFYFVVAPAIEEGTEAIKRGSLIALLIWYVVDSGASVAAGAPMNALSNSVFAVFFLVPLIAVKSPAATSV